ncbi:MAG: hypothetical protein CL878_05290 [Dehalococcoidia bacterium]|nr:hypothetical protein [Dehalococcoidia bacterium]
MIRLRHLKLGNFKGLQHVDLAFPDRGTVLIEGLNEAGKSSLFDGLHFALYGLPLVGDQASAVAYNAEVADASAVLDVDDTRLTLRRRVRLMPSGPRHEVELWVQTSGDEAEYVRGVRAVGGRLIAEMGGLTAEALQNSCLVVQKQLGRLEGLSRRDREEALGVLLNLSRLSVIERTLRATREHERKADRAGRVAGLAKAIAVREELEGELGRAQRKERFAHLRDLVASLEDSHLEAQEAAQERDAAARQLDAVRERIEAIAKRRRQKQAWQDTLAAVERAEETAAQLSTAKKTADSTTREAAALDQSEQALAAAYAIEEQVRAIRAKQEDSARLKREHNDVRRRLAEWGDRAEQLGAVEQEVQRQTSERKRLAAEIAASRVELATRPGQEQRLEALKRLVQRSTEHEERLRSRVASQQLHAQHARIAATAAGVRSRRSSWASVEAAAGMAEERSRAVDSWEKEAAALVSLADAHKRLDELEPVLLAEEERREQVAELRRLSSVHAHLTHWIALAKQRHAAAAAKRLLGDLAFAVTEVQWAQSKPGPGLRLRLQVAHPSLEAREIEFLLGPDLTTVLAERSLESDEAAQLDTDRGLLPGMSATDVGDLNRQLEQTAGALADLDEPDPGDVEQARQRTEATSAALGHLGSQPGQGLDDTAFRGLLAEQAQLRKQLASLDRDRSHVTFLTKAAEDARAELRSAREHSDAALRKAGEALAAARDDDQTASFDGDLTEGSDLVAVRLEAARQLGPLDERLVASEVAAQEAATLAKRLASLDEAINADEESAAVQAQKLALPNTHTRTVQIALDQSQESVRSLRSLADGHDLLKQQLVTTTAEITARTAERDRLAARQQDPDRPALAAALAELETRQATLAEDLHQRWASLESQTGVAASRDLGAAERAIQEQIRQAHRAQASAAAAEKRRPAEQARLVALRARYSELKEATREHFARLGAATPDDLSEAGAFAQQEITGEESAIGRLDPEEAAASERTAQERHSLARVRAERSADEGHRLGAAAREVTSELGITLPEVDAPWDLATHVMAELPVSQELPSKEAARERVAEVTQRIARTEQDIQRDREGLDLPTEYLVPEVDEAVEAALDAGRDLRSRRIASRVLTRVRGRLIANVLPSTEKNMCVLLPELTAGRYRHARLDQDYRFQVWDERKRGYTEKRLLSGGTQDQFSLALRLGFAIAALPQEVGTRPGFLFLDEPLSSFDRDRTEALVNLLTRGPITSYFPQVFLISHSTLFDPHLFTYHVAMEEGGGASSTLPPPEPEVALPS